MVWCVCRTVSVWRSRVSSTHRGLCVRMDHRPYRVSFKTSRSISHPLLLLPLLFLNRYCTPLLLSFLHRFAVLLRALHLIHVCLAIHANTPTISNSSNSNRNSSSSENGNANTS